MLHDLKIAESHIAISIKFQLIVHPYTVNPNKLPELIKIEVIDCLNFFKLINLKVKFFQNIKVWITCTF